MKASYIAIALAGFCLFVGCRRAEEGSTGAVTESTTKDVQPAAGGSKAGGEGTLVVLGRGKDLYDVFDESGQNKINFTNTSKPLQVPAGSFVVILNGSRRPAVVKPGEETRLETGVLLVKGLGKDLYDVFDKTGQDKLHFTRTNQPTELFEGEYVVKMNNASTPASVRAGEETVVEAGSVLVEGDGKTLYEVYDQDSTHKLNFTATGRVMEMLPGSYTIVCAGKQYPAEVKAGQQTTIKPE